jgi:maltose-binding protein MalE
MKVRFSVVEEFLAELDEEQNHVEDSIVRITYQYEQSTSVPFIYHMRVVAGFVVRGKLVYLKQACGDVWQGQGRAPETQAKEKAAEIAAQIEAKAGELNLSVRHGIFEP